MGVIIVILIVVCLWFEQENFKLKREVKRLNEIIADR